MKKKQLYIKNDKGRYEPYVEPKREDHNLYVREINGKYRAIGLRFDDRWLGEGLWLIRKQGKELLNADHFARCWGITKVADVPYTDMTKIGAAADIYEAVDKYLFKTHGYTVNNVPHQDLSEEIVKDIMNMDKNEAEC